MIPETSADRLNRLLAEVRVSPLPADLRRNLVSIPPADPSPSTRNGLANIFNQLREIVAELVHDSFGSIAIAGSRAAAVSARDVVHRWDDSDLVLTIPLGDDLAPVIQGQVFGPNESRWIVSISFPDGRPDTQTSIDDDGSFAFVLSDRSAFTVQLTDDAVAVRCGPISLDGH